MFVSVWVAIHTSEWPYGHMNQYKILLLCHVFGRGTSIDPPSLFDVNRGTPGDEKPICQAEYDRKVKVPNMAGLQDLTQSIETESGYTFTFIVRMIFK